MDRQPEIEICIRDCPKARLLVWLESVLGELGLPENAGEATEYASKLGPVVLTPNVKDSPFQSVLFKTAKSPWVTSVDCGRQAAQDLACVVRCEPGQHYPEVNPKTQTFLEIEGESEKLVHWE